MSFEVSNVEVVGIDQLVSWSEGLGNFILRRLKKK